MSCVEIAPVKAHRSKIHATMLILGMLVLGACGGSSEDEDVVNAPTTNVSVAGVVSYEDKEYDNRGFTGNTALKSVRHAAVDLVDAYGKIVDTTVTDARGNYTLEGTGSGLYVRVMAQTSEAAGSVVMIHNYSGDAYAITQSLDSQQGDVTLDFDIDLENSTAGVFNMLDVFTSASLFLSSISTNSLPQVSIYWQTASSNYGTYFCPSTYAGGACPRGKGIYILGGSSSGGDTDEYDDDVLLHEYAHYVELAMGVKDSPGGSHYLTDNDHDLRLAWSEGLGGFFPNAVKTWIAENDPQRLSSKSTLASSYFIDTYGSYASISIDIAAPNAWLCPGGVDCFVYSSSEISVAKVLSDLQAQFGIEPVWAVISGYMRSDTDAPATLESFWDGWQQQRAPGAEETQALDAVYSDRLVNFRQDVFEQDNSIADARALDVCNDDTCDAEQHFLYLDDSSTDIDMFSFAATAGESYFIETLDLGNGADTHIRLLDGTGNVVVNGSGQSLVNDDRPGTVYCYQYDNPCRIHYDDVMLSSSLTFTAPTSGTYYVEVKSSSDRPVGSGRYGTYSIRVSAE